VCIGGNDDLRIVMMVVVGVVICSSIGIVILFVEGDESMHVGWVRA